jgi:hypothetical protein
MTGTPARAPGLLLGLVFVLAGCISVGVTTIASFTSADGHFSVTLPKGTTTESTSTGSGPFAASTIHTFVHAEPGEPLFAAIYGDADPAFIASMSNDAALDWAEQANVGATNGHQVAERNLTISGLSGRGQSIVGPTGSYVFRMVLAGDRLYSFSVKGTDVQVQQADAIVYLDSFAITP